MSAALSGMQQAQGRLEQTAQRVAQAGANPAAGDTVDLSAEMVNLLRGREEFGANARVAHVGAEMQKSLLDLLG